MMLMMTLVTMVMMMVERINTRYFAYMIFLFFCNLKNEYFKSLIPLVFENFCFINRENLQMQLLLRECLKNNLLFFESRQKQFVECTLIVFELKTAGLAS